MPPQPPAPPKIPWVAQQLLEVGERVLTVVHKSIIVLIGLYLEVLVGVGALAALIFTVSPGTLSTLTDGSLSSLIILTLLTALIIVILILVTLIYLQNQLIITDRGVIQITQRGPFSNKAARLSIASVEDVSANQSGLLATLFNYGTLLIQTAGTLENFQFTYCPNPNRYAHDIVMAREAYAEALRESNENNP